MTTDMDLDLTFHDIATAGFKVVRTWAFNDVPKKPSSGPYFQVSFNPFQSSLSDTREKILDGGRATINEGADGLQRLDKVVAAAEKYGIKLIFSLTNNWNPERPLNNTAWNRRENAKVGFPRGYLSNDYGMFDDKAQPVLLSIHVFVGGMDLYVRNFHPGGTHDLFYIERAIIDAFKDYVGHVVKRFIDKPTILAWELGNDLRCSSTLSSSPKCNTATITNWTAEICECFVRTMLISFINLHCSKLH
jgi:mannan endo-1,4-beta-mannosidase